MAFDRYIGIDYSGAETPDVKPSRFADVYCGSNLAAL